MTHTQILAIKKIAEKHGFVLYSISKYMLTGRYDEAPESIEELEVIQADLDAINLGLHFFALQIMSVDAITFDTPIRIAQRLRKGHKAGQKSLKEAVASHLHIVEVSQRFM